MALTYFFRGGCAIYLTVKKSIPNLPETANVPEDGATLQVQNGPNCAIYPILIKFLLPGPDISVIKALKK